LLEIDPVSVTLECFKENLADLPNSVGGTSGGALWRVYVRRGADESFETVHHRLIGIASKEERVTPLRCQGLGRIEALLEGVRRGMCSKPNAAA
jgi:hypothetical protein